MPDPNSRMLPGSGTVPVPLVELVLALPSRVNDSEGIVPTSLLEADDGPEFSSQ
jgi:hypothetical protein